MSVSLIRPAGALLAFVVGSSTVFAQPALPTGALHKASDLSRQTRGVHVCGEDRRRAHHRPDRRGRPRICGHGR